MNSIRRIPQFFKNFLGLIIEAGKNFANDKIPKLSSSLAYCTLFAITPLLTIIIASASILYSKSDVQEKVNTTLADLIGPNVATQIGEFMNNASLSGKSTIALIIGAVSLVIGATAVFTEIQDSINTIWKVKAIPKKGWKKFLLNRLLSFSLIITLGFLLLVSLIISSIIAGLQSKIQQILPFSSILLFQVLNFAITLAVITTLFAVIFKVLPDVIIKWKPAFIGAAFTALLFMLGKYLIQLYIAKANPGAVFGTAASIVLLLLWVYYTSFILYFGAEFTQVYAKKYSTEIRPSKYAVHLKTVIDDDYTTPSQNVHHSGSESNMA